MPFIVIKGWTIIFVGGGTFFVKKLFASCNWLKKIVCKAKGKFFEIH